MRHDTIIYNGTIVTVNPTADIIKNGLIGITDGIIAYITTTPIGTPLPEADTYIDAQNGIILPGLINTHTHLPMSLFRGLADDLPLMTWLNDYIFPSEAKHITPDTVKTGALLSAAEMLLSGITTCCDGYFYEDHIAAALETTGMRAILAQGVIDFPAPGVPDPSQNVKTAQDFVLKWTAKNSRITPSVFCHSPYTCSKNTLNTAKQIADENNALFQIHVAETRDEWEQIQKEHHRTPIRYLDDIGVLNTRTLLVHCVWVDDEDIRRIADRNSAVSHNAESNLKLASGIAPVAQMLDSGISVGLGTDGCASNNDLDLFAEMDTVAKLHKAHQSDPTCMNAQTVLEAATINGAKAIGLDKRVGSLEIGKQADIIVLDTQKPHCVPMYHPISHLVYAANRTDVQHVLVDGELLVHHRQVLRFDIDHVMREALLLSQKIQK